MPVERVTLQNVTVEMDPDGKADHPLAVLAGDGDVPRLAVGNGI